MNRIRSFFLIFAGVALLGTSVLAEKTVVVEGNDAMQFSIKKIEAPAGSELTIVFRNTGSMPKMAMGHNLVVLKPGADAQAFSLAAMAAAATEYVPTAMKDQVLATTKLLGPNEEDTITFTFPDESGELAYVCSFPGHYGAGMKGVIVITE